MGTAILWAVVGMISYRFISAILDAGRNTLFAKKVVYQCLTLMGAIIEDLAFMRELKYLHMRETGVSEEQVQFVKKIDEQTLNNWKEATIRTFKSSFPGTLESIVKFNNWQEAMRELDRIHKEK